MIDAVATMWAKNLALSKIAEAVGANEGSQKEPIAATSGGCALHSPSTAVDSRG